MSLRGQTPEPSSDHSHDRDFTVQDVLRPPPVEIPPEVAQLGAMLTDMPPERRQVLSEAESENGWPAWWGRWVERMGWDAFKHMCLRALADFHERGIAVEIALLDFQERTPR